MHSSQELAAHEVKWQELDALCVKLELSSEARYAVEKAVNVLTDFQNNKDKFRSGPKQLNELDTLRDQVKALEETLRNMEARNLWRMQYALGELGFPGALMNPNSGVQLRVENFRPAMAGMLGIVSDAIEMSRDKIPPETLREGRISVRYFYALAVSNLAFTVCTKLGELTLSRNGKFQRLCDAIFAVAGVGSGSEGAIKFLMTFRKEHPPETPFLWNDF